MKIASQTRAGIIAPVMRLLLFPATVVRSYTLHRHLIRQLATREVAGRYRGSLFGLAWSLLNPLILLAIYTFVFGLIFRSRWPGLAGEAGTAGFSVVAFSGIVIHGFLAECVTKAPGQIVSNPNFVKKVVFPLEVLAWAGLGAALFHLAVNMVVLLVFQVLVLGVPPVTAWLAPVALLPVVLLALGCMWAISAFSVYFRDLGQIMGLVMTVLFFLSPVFYPIEAVPETVRPLLYLNPLTDTIVAFRELMLWGRMPDWFALAVQGGIGLAACVAGYGIFQWFRKGFADVL